ncbi:MAG: tetratricopeptide repeat protein [Candidatus Riflebacteria bacterium]|nr:tetratricopeptide repeat protein [Candidatus Riflebacteria bacterium]
MNPGEEKEVNLSNEFFKKLNQQIVQKDNLIKLLQLQIKNLKAQESAEQGPKKADLMKSLETKESEIQKLQSELENHRDKLAESIREKDEQIEALNRAIEESYREKGDQGGSSLSDAQAGELQQKMLLLESELEEEKRKTSAATDELTAEKDRASFEIGQMKATIDAMTASLEETESLRTQVASLETQLSNASSAPSAPSQENPESAALIESLKAQLAAKDSEVEFANAEIPRLNEELTALKQILDAKDAEVSQKETTLKEEIAALKASHEAVVAELESLKASAPVSTPAADIEAVSTELAALKEQFEHNKAELDSTKSELEAAKSMASAPNIELEAAKAELEFAKSSLDAANLQLEALKAEIELASAQPQVDPAEKEQLLNQIQELSAKVARIDELEAQSAAFTETESALTILRGEMETLQKVVELKTVECNDLNSEMEGLKAKLAEKPEYSASGDVDQLMEQVADQLLAIQKFEQVLQHSQEEAAEKDAEIARLKAQIADNTAPRDVSAPFSSENDVFICFIEFFDQLDNFLKKNPNPELQILHNKLIQKLILPNEIQYMPVVAEKYDPAKHVATDFFKSDKFEDLTVVFEVEKGYKRGDSIVKKSKVWVVQNHFDCGSCNARIVQSDSRFCHKCGAMIVAPNGLPADGIPEFEPNPSTYLRFAERMIEKGSLETARGYLEEGLKLDPQYLPLLLRVADVYSLTSNFEKAIDFLNKAIAVKPDNKLSEKIRGLEVKNNIFQQARALNLPPSEFEKLVLLIQK